MLKALMYEDSIDEGNQRLIDGDFYQKSSLERVIKMEEKIRKEIKEEVIPDLSWAGYGE